MEELSVPGVVYDDIGPELIVETWDPDLDFRGVLVIDNSNLGVGKGGIRMTPTVTTPEVARLARAMTYKNALAGLPFGGAKAGIIADPKTFSKAHKRAVIESFARSLAHLIPTLYIAGPDMNTTELEMEQFARAHGSFDAATGKPASFTTKTGGKKRQGLPHELGSTGFGVALSAVLAAGHKGINLDGINVSIAGYGNVGMFAHQFLQERGARIIAISDSTGTAYDRKGLDHKTMMDVKKKSGSVQQYPGAKRLTRDVVYEITTDILIPAAGPDVITSENVGRVKAQIIVQGANIPMSEAHEAQLHRKEVLIVPDIIANAGGVISSFAEYKGYDAKKMFALVEDKITTNLKEILETVGKGTVAPRSAAMKMARQRVLAGKKKK